MDAVDAIYGRRAVREFTGETPPHEEISALVEAAVQAPNGMNRQPWAFVIVNDRAAVARFAAKAKAYQLRNLPAKSALHGLHDQLASDTFDIFYGAPVLVLICATDDDPMSVKDCCLAAENLMLAAHDRQMGTCWIGLAEPWLESAEGRRELGIPGAYHPVAPIILGFPASAPSHPHRRAADVRWVSEPVSA